MKEIDKYLLRYAAGAHWLIKIDQQDVKYTAPFMINEVGVLIWKGMEEGYGIQELSMLLCNQYNIDLKEALKDVEQFVEQLKKWSIITTWHNEA